MRITTLTLFPSLYEPFFKTSLMARAIEAGIVSCELKNIFSYTEPKKRIDSPTFGPTAGMLLRPDIIQKAVEESEAAYGKAYKIFFSPKGKVLDQPLLRNLAKVLQERKHMLLLPARYEGMDARVEEEYADCLLSIGNYVLMGGDIPAMVLMEGMLRLIPGVVGKEESIVEESYTGPFLDYPEYTSPVVWKDKEVPEIVRSGNHKAIEEWRKQQAAAESVQNHFGWVRSHVYTKEDKQLAGRQIPPHYVILMHDEVMLDGERTGTSSVTSLDIHDIARSACTYGIKHYFMVTPLKDQQKIIETFLGFWRSDVAIDYNPQRHEALKMLSYVDTLETALSQIEKDTGLKPLVIATSAKKHEGVPLLSYHDQQVVWQNKRPVVILLGTARGLADSVLKRCDYLLGPVEGFSDFNHLSVRSAAAIILDRWLGINTVTKDSNKG
jgi:tRNA (guanine37-N1)-methyltransferase